MDTDFGPATVTTDANGYRAESRTARLHNGSRTETGFALTGN
ncbi:hypothetical protein [Streptomyces mirabilis]